ncbi:MAG: peptide ABC transporter substrate-binding protein [Chromatiales bacterium]|nr:peptide ABC transporter substrate-binding protein [Chromatiales bacterium]
MKLRAALAGLLLLATAQLAAQTQALHRGTAADPPSLDPTLASGTLATSILVDLVTGLLTRAADSSLTPGLAERWTIDEDGLRYTFHLREGLRWSDGRVLDADDFVWSYQRLFDPATASPAAGTLFVIRNSRAAYSGELPLDQIGVTAPDARTVVFDLEEPVPYFLELLAGSNAVPVPRHVIEEYGREWTRAGRMVSSGPFMLVERVPQSHIRLARNPYFHAAGDIRLDEVWWHPTQDLATSLRRYRSGELDIVLNFPPEEISRLRRQMPDALRIVPAQAVYFLAVNIERPPFDDVRVRRALSLAIDREGLTTRLLRTGVTPATSLVTDAITDYPGLVQPEFARPVPERQAEARALLAAAGFGPDNPLTVPLVYDTQEENRQLMVAIASMWRAIGVQTQVENVQFSQLNRLVRTRDYSVARWAYFAAFDDAYSFLQLFETGNPGNPVNYSNPEYDALLALANRSADPEERRQLLLDAERRLMEDQPLIPIYFYAGRRLVSPRVQGWVDTPRGPTPSRWLWVE